MKDADLTYAIGLKPEKAIEFFKSKGYSFSWDWHETIKEAHAKAFTVAKVMRMDILKDIRKEVTRALETGSTLQEFKKNLIPTLQKKGWWGRKLLGDGKGGAKEVQLGSPRRLKTIYQTNLQSAYMAGRKMDMLENVDYRPYWQYVAVMDRRTRPEHAAMDGKVFRHDDPVWDYGPPYDFNCRCRTRPLSERNLNERGLSVEDTTGRWKEEEALLSRNTGEVVKIPGFKTVDPQTGRPIVFKPGAGWGYDAVKAAWQPDLEKYDYAVARKYIEGAVTGPAFTRFFEGKDKGTYPVAVLDEAYRKAIGARTQTVLLSDESLAKNKGLKKGFPGHPELTIEEYQKLPRIVSQAEVIIKDSDVTLIFIKLEDRFYHAAIKTTKSGEALFLTSFRRVDDLKREIARVKRKRGAKVIKDEWNK